MQKNSLNLNRGYGIALLSAIILSLTGIFIRILTQTYQLPALVLAFWRDAIVAITLLLVFRLLAPARYRIHRKDIFPLIVHGLVLAVFNSLWTLSVAMNGAAVSTVLAYSSAGFTALLGWWFLKEGLGWVKIVAVIFSLTGCVFISGAYTASAWSTNELGILTGILSGLCYAIYSLMGRSAARRGLNPWTTLLYCFGIAAIFLLFFNMQPFIHLPGATTRVADFFWLGNDLVGWGILMLLAIGPTLLGFGLYNMSLSSLPASIANLIVSLEPAFTAIIAYYFLGEHLTITQLGGGLMILAGVVFIRMNEGRFDARAKPVRQNTTI